MYYKVIRIVLRHSCC